MMKVNQIQQRLKQRPPFQMIEKVVELKENQSAKGIKNVSINEPYFIGHFPDTPIMPGVLIIECCAQLCSLVFENQKDSQHIYVLLKVDNFKFIHPVIPGDTLMIEVNKIKDAGVLTSFEALVSVDGKTHAKGILTFTSMDKKDVYGREDES